MTAHIQQARLLSGRSMTFMAVVGLHVLLITALIAFRIVPPLVDPGPVPIVVTSVPPPETVPPPLPSLLKPPQIIATTTPVIPLPNLIIPADAGEPVAAVVESIATPAVGPGATAEGPVAPAARVSTELQFRIVRPSDDYYPEASLRLEEHGVTIVRVCVGASGRMEGVPTIQSSSGHRRLDQAAVRWARESLTFVPATQDGMAVAACKGFRVNFSLR